MLFEDGIYAEYAVFTLDELAGAAYAGQAALCGGAPTHRGAGASPARSPASARPADWYVGEALTNLYVGLHRDQRGERLSAMRLIQVHALDRLIELLHVLRVEPRGRARTRSAWNERLSNWDASVLPLAELAPGYEHNREAALAMLFAVLEGLVPVDTRMARAIRELAR